MDKILHKISSFICKFFLKLENSKNKLLLIIIFLFSSVCYAQSQNSSDDLFNVLDSIQQIFYGTSLGWLVNSESYAKYILIGLAVFDVFSVGIRHVLKVESAQEVFGELLFKCLWIGGFLTILQFLPMLTDPNTGFIAGFEVLGSKITGISRLSPTGVIDTGLDITGSLVKHMKDAPLTAIFEAGMYLIAICVVIYSFTVVAVELIITKVEAYLLMFGGCVFLGFAGSEKTKMYAVGYIRYLTTVGVKLLIAYLIVAVGIQLGDSVVKVLAKDPLATGDYQSVILTVIIFVIYAAIAKRTHAIAQGFLSGVSTSTGSDVTSTGGPVLMTTTAMVTGGRMAAPGSMQGMLGGLGQNLGQMAGGALFKGAGHAHAAFNSVKANTAQNMSNGAPMETAAPHAMAQTAGTAMSNMAQSVKSGVGDRASQVMKSHQTNVNNSPFTPKPPSPPKNNKS